jgi:hypothetical protein
MLSGLFSKMPVGQDSLTAVPLSLPCLKLFFAAFKKYYCCAGWGYIVAFIKVLIMYQIYHT